MTEPTAAPVAAATEAEALEAPENSPDSAVELSEDTAEVEAPEAAEASVSRRDQKLAEEAARWRIQTRQAETKLAVAEARIAEMQKAEVERLLATRLAMPSDLWLSGKFAVEDLLTNGQVDAERVNAAADTVLESRPHWAARLKPVGAPAASVTGDGKYEPPKTVSWQSLLQGNAG